MVAITWKAMLLMLTILITQQLLFIGAVQVGINYGFLGDNLPPPTDVINFIESKPIVRVRIFDPNHEVLEAMRNSFVSVCVGTRNEDLPSLAASQQATDDWFATNIAPYIDDVDIYLITVGNEVIPGENAQYVLPAIQNMQNTVDAAGLATTIKVTTVFSMGVLGTSYPPSAGAFAPELADTMNQLVTYINSIVSPIMINVYPFFPLSSQPQHITLDYALFTSQTPVLQDGDLQYFNLFDAMVDSFYAAIYNAIRSDDFEIVISETGWPSAGSEYATIANAQTYNNNLKNHVMTKGTPRRPDVLLDTYIFALFNENQKPAGTEQNFGSFYPDMTPVYPLW